MNTVDWENSNILPIDVDAQSVLGSIPWQQKTLEGITHDTMAIFQHRKAAQTLKCARAACGYDNFFFFFAVKLFCCAANKYHY